MVRVLGCYLIQVPASILAEFNTSTLQTATTTDHGFSSMAFAAPSITRCRN
jgi:hypothetical protein